ncbi:MAG: hypothetical protein ACJ8J7_06180 [Sulfurifustaceae bacterium]
MKNKSGGTLHRVAAALGIFFLVTHAAYAELSVATGIDYSSGDYGTSEETRVTYVPLTLKYETERAVFRLTVPYLRIDGPSGGQIIGIGPGGQPIRTPTGARATNQGLGDVIAAVGYNLLDASGTLLDVVGKVKLGTADETKGLGTGENDYSLQLDWSQQFGRFTLVATIGYRIYGDPPGVNFDNALFASAGGILKYGSDMSFGLIYDFRQSIVADTDSQRDITAFISYKLNARRKIQGYVTTGLSNASPDWGVGAIATIAF